MAPPDADTEETNSGETPRPDGVSTRKTPPGATTPTLSRGRELRNAGYFLGLVLVGWQLRFDGSPAVGALCLAVGIGLLSVSALIDRWRRAESPRDGTATDDRNDADATRAGPDREESG